MGTSAAETKYAPLTLTIDKARMTESKEGWLAIYGVPADTVYATKAVAAEKDVTSGKTADLLPTPPVPGGRLPRFCTGPCTEFRN